MSIAIADLATMLQGLQPLPPQGAALAQLQRAQPVRPLPMLSDEQAAVLDAVSHGDNVIVDATAGSGKTATIQQLCVAEGKSRQVLYLTYSKLLKHDAQARVTHAKVQNYHGIVYPWLIRLGIRCGISESIRQFNRNWDRIAPMFPTYDLLVVDEYQDINEEYATLLRNIRSKNPSMQIVFVGDLEQKVRSDTVLDVQDFARDFVGGTAARHLPFTTSFRLGPEMAELLSYGWNKPIQGANTDQVIRHVSYGEAVELIGESAPGEILSLGKREGLMSRALNEVEERFADRYNKATAYASIKDGDDQGSYGDDAAVFTTFDGSKGLERHRSIVFDFTPEYWKLRTGFPGADPVVLRNIFLVAASRGKGEIVFVGDRAHGRTIGQIPVTSFRDLAARRKPAHYPIMQASQCFDFTYAEHVEHCVDLLERERLDDGSGTEITIERSDGLIDLSPAVGHYQEALFFEGYDPRQEVSGYSTGVVRALDDQWQDDDPWRNSLLLTASDTKQDRYVTQVKRGIPDDAARALVERLGERLDPRCQAQMQLTLNGTVRDRRAETAMTFAGVVDAVYRGRIYELKFTSELTYPMFLQLALYLVMADIDEGVLWNTRTDERWRVRVPDRRAFMNAVVTCVTKGDYTRFES